MATPQDLGQQARLYPSFSDYERAGRWRHK